MASATPKSGEHFVTQLLEKLGVPVKHLVTDSRKLRAGDTFLAYAGENYDARKDIPQAIAAGVNAVIWESINFSGTRIGKYLIVQLRGYKQRQV